MKIKLNYGWLHADAVPQIQKDFPELRSGLETLLEHHGALIDRRERLIKQPVIYAEIKELQGINALLKTYGLQVEQQGEYRA
jgi:hypothetical protein